MWLENSGRRLAVIRRQGALRRTRTNSPLWVETIAEPSASASIRPGRCAKYKSESGGASVRSTLESSSCGDR